MKKDEIVKAVRDYVNNDKAKYAVLITGGWGTGKTFFYENDLRTEILLTESGKDNRKANVYISLYGISSIEQLSKEIVINYLIKVKLHSSQKKSKIYSQIGNIIGVCSKMFSFSFNGLSVDFEKGIKGIEGGIDFKDMIICMDDFERCNIPVNELFGMINNLVEHCNCKVIILADEDSIGKMYTNANIEMKYLTLLMGRKVVIKDADTQSITIEELKRLNEKVYSDNYIYKNIKEKVIGLTLKYESNMKDDYKPIIESVINSQGLCERLLENKEKILGYMDKCETNNIRIMKMWLLNFEKIYKVIDRCIKCNDDKRYFNDIFDRFALYSIKVACALGKNNSLREWDDEMEIGYRDFGDNFGMAGQGYKFVDDLFKDSILNEQKILSAVNFIIRERKEEEEKEIDSHKREAYDKLSNLYYLEDEEIEECRLKMKEEIERDEFKPQNYQNIIATLVLLKQEECIDENFINEIYVILKNKLESMKGIIDIENIHFDFSCQESVDLFHKYYNPLYFLMMEKNKEIDKQEKTKSFSFSNASDFLFICTYPPANPIVHEAYISDFDLKKLIWLIQTGNINEIYDIARGIEKLSVKTGDLRIYNRLFIKLIKTSFDGKMRKKAVKYLFEVIQTKVDTIRNADKDDVNN